jgi:DNA anti-recombination protein RmuC|tara:strand:+ start:274 stop:477 length:204 start_codon:yes stop_codon:yes gene_type:complete
MPRKKKVEELPGYEKDTVTNAVINTNSSAFSNRRDQLQKLREKDGVIEQMQSDIEELKKIIKKLGSK